MVFSALVYVFSYAPVVRMKNPFILYSGTDYKGFSPTSGSIDGHNLPLFRPIDWLIDETPLRRPLLWWAELWGVRDCFELAHWRRANRT